MELRKDEKMSRNEIRNAEKKVYTLEDIIQEILDEQDYSEKESRGLTKQNISNFLTEFFKEMGLDDAKAKLKNGKDYAFTEQEKPTIKRLIMERNGKLRRNKSGEYKEQIEKPDFEFLFDIVNSIMGMLERRGYQDEEKLQIAVERYMTDFLKNEASISDTISQRLQKLIESNISNKNTVLKVSDKFIWMRAMEKELNEVIDKWICIFDEYNDLLEDMISERIEEIYDEMCEGKIGNETFSRTKGELFDECVKKYFTEYGKDQLELLYEEREKILSERVKIEERYNEQIQFYRTTVDKRSKNKRLCLEEFMRMLNEMVEIDDKIKMIEKKKERIYIKCQELAYDEVFGEDEEKFFKIYDAGMILQKAKANVEYDMRYNSSEKVQTGNRGMQKL